MTITAVGRRRTGGMTRDERRVVFAASLGTVFEWYDFYIYGALGVILADKFFSNVNPTAAFIFTLLAFAAGFAVRPFGALVFGRIGDMVGRKYTFLVTMALMGFGTFLIGLLPSYATIGIAAPVMLVALRLVQGLALGGEYGGAAIYVAEHAPPGRRGYYTSWIQTTATGGLFMALLVILGLRTAMGEENFAAWGWRLPFLLSIVLLAVSVWIRLQLEESPVFRAMKDQGKGSKAPIKDSFTNWRNGKVVLLALLGATAGEAVIWYGGQFYALYFLTQMLKVEHATANILIAVALLIGTPGFILFGWLSDKIGRKPIMLAGFALAVTTYFPIFQALTHAANPALERALAASPVSVVADPAECSFQFNPVGLSQFRTSCDIAKSALVGRAVSYRNVAAPAGAIAVVKVGDTTIPAFDGTALKEDEFAEKAAAFEAALGAAIRAHGYPDRADPAEMNFPMTTFLLVMLVVYVTLVYGPIAAWLVELFPTRIRYSSMSLPYHIGNGWFGGFLPATAFAIVAATGDIYSGLWYPVAIAATSFVVALIFLPETKHVDIS
ncbi:Permeases of the major facilitator superfamily [Rhodovulum sp. PH10]|uniref:MFS transporter n=1 Tax=Rhodovulum sp. PH10 TaxID=1187851 RepID=UPI00027C2C26|nr:MFS transporter [Rhodovulum sp. PH10]EJW11642.1 Permeases of the major facilitator superfamily [Rhodovulum sp. PH10]